MPPAADPLLERIRGDGLIVPGRPYVALLSGGRDSTCLLHLAAEIVGGARVTALHVNYGLRDAADADERHCAELCAALGVHLVVERPRPLVISGNVQAWARESRYGPALKLARARGAELLTGHTADDQVETVLYRLISSPSRRALYGMHARRGGIVRPLLAIARAETTAYCERNRLAWREDESNASSAYVRNRIRHELLPLIRTLHPGVDINLLTLAGRLYDEGVVLEGVVDETLAGESTIRLERLQALPHALAGLVVQRLADDALGEPAAGAAAHSGTIRVMLGVRGTTEVAIGNGLRAISEYGVVRIERMRPPDPVPAPARLRVPGEAVFGHHRVRCEACDPAPGPGVLDRDGLGGELLVRAWRAGDRIRPLGLGGSKSLQDLFTDRRVPREQRVRVPVVAAGDEIVWVAGLATADRVRITDRTRAAVRLSVSAAGTPDAEPE